MNSFRVMLLGLCVCLLVATGCGGGRKVPVAPAPQGTAKYPVKVGVLPLKDERGNVRKSASRKNTAPLSWYKSYEFSRFDEEYRGGMEPYNTLLGKYLAEDLAKSGYWQQVDFIAPDNVPLEESTELPPADVYVQTTMKAASVRGYWLYYSLILPFGFFLNDVAWAAGAPKDVRRWDIDMSMQLVDAYTRKPIGNPVEVKYTTSGDTDWVYNKASKINDLRDKFGGVANGFNKGIASQVPNAGDSYWATLKTEGAAYLAAAASNVERIQRGPAPTIQFGSPADNSIVRSDSVAVNWTANVPGGLKSVQLLINGMATNTGIMPSGQNAIPLRADTVPLKLGANTIAAVIEDQRGNAPQRLEITVNRLPLALVPEKRYALVMGAGSAEAKATATSLGDTLGNSLVGQVPGSALNVVAADTFSKTALMDGIKKLGTARSGELAIIYVAAPADAATLSIGSGSEAVPLKDLMTTIRTTLATEEVLLVLDLDFGTAAPESIAANLGSLPNRWAVLIGNATPAPALRSGGQFTLGSTLVKALTTQPAGTDRRTLESLLDEATLALESNGRSPVVEGRYNANMTMSEFK